MNLKYFESYSRSGNPIVGASVYLYAASDTHPNPGSPLQVTSTDSNGIWEFTGLADGKYDVKVDIPGIGQTKWYKGNIKLGAAEIHALTTGSPGAKVYHNANQSLTNGAFAALAFNSEEYDNDAIHDTSSNNTRLTCKTAGKYLVMANITFASNATGYRYIYFRLNGTVDVAEQAVPAISGSDQSVSLATEVDLAVNDYLEVMAGQSSGGSLNVLYAGATHKYSPRFMMRRVSD